MLCRKRAVLLLIVEGLQEISSTESLACQGTLEFPSKKRKLGSSLAVQWLGLSAFTATDQIQSLVRELRPHKLSSVAKKKKRKRKLVGRVMNAWRKKGHLGISARSIELDIGHPARMWPKE